MRMRMLTVRMLLSTVLFLMLAQVNVWVNTQTHLILAVGYRTFLLAAPFFIFKGLSKGMHTAIALCLFSILFGMYSLSGISVAVFALGMAVSGYLAKSVMAHTSRGAADNKVSLNIGSLFSGLILMSMTNRFWILLLCSGVLLCALYLSFKVDWESMSPAKTKNQEINLQDIKPVPLLGWLLIGIATGIKLTGVFTILPQYLMFKLGFLPRWYGMLIVLNSLVVIFAQHRVLSFLDRTRHSRALLCSLSAMILLALPAVLRVENPLMSVVWILLLTLGECALSLYDRIAKEKGYLFFKELMVGVGSFATVVLSRSFAGQIYWSGLAGAACLFLGAFLISYQEVRVLSFSPNVELR